MNMLIGNKIGEVVRCYNDCSQYRLEVKIGRKTGGYDVVEIKPSTYADLSYEDACDYGVMVTVFREDINLEWQVISSVSFLGNSEIRFNQRNHIIYWTSIEGTYLDRIRVSSLPSKVGEYLKMKAKEVKDLVRSQR
uniref:Uncharacterized protein n=1 Tax=Cannabis sativa TaxID=3483 RepID=A0A803Q4T5_CANSA